MPDTASTDTTAPPTDPTALPSATVEPAWVVRIDFENANGRAKTDHRVSDTPDIEVAVRVAGDQVRAKHEGCTIARIEAFKPAMLSLTSRSRAHA